MEGLQDLSDVKQTPRYGRYSRFRQPVVFTCVSARLLLVRWFIRYCYIMPGYPPRHVCALPNYFRSLLHLPPQHDTAPHITEARTLTDVRSRGSCAQFVSHITRRLRSRHSVITLRSRSYRRLITRQGSHFTRSKPAPRASSPQSRRGTHTRSAATRDAPRPITPSIPRPKSHRPVHPTSYHPFPSHASRPKGQGARHLSCSHTSISLGAMPRSRSHSSDLVGRNAEIAISLFRSRWARCRDRAGRARRREGRVRERPHRDSQGTRASFACSAGAVPPGRSLA